ncbi:DUF4249 domain-containing protein [Hymenobacter sp. DG01]|uniref:DUF4249 domain-containing protein n=1 Tax=Hymenobacter sp. DG01 TaxID=2584940 RepID=UPI00111DDB68|nr:DUF4249 domain-containing protein [Hymenobacter sp. DG01]
MRTTCWISRILGPKTRRLPGALLTGAGAVAAGLLSSCGLQKDIDVELPAYPAQLVVEAYLENGRLPRIAVSESVPYLAEPQVQVPTDVTVVLTRPNGTRDTLRYAPGLNMSTDKAYTHSGRTRLVARPGDVFQLEAYDTRGRRVTGSATMPALVPIDNIQWQFDTQPAERRQAYLTVKFQDPAATTDYYRFQVHKSSLGHDPDVEYTVEDRLTNGQAITLGTSYEFKANDTLFVTLYHLDRPYYQFLQSVQDARNANGNPFAQPSAVRSTVTGGVGVFTVLSYQRQRVILR